MLMAIDAGYKVHAVTFSREKQENLISSIPDPYLEHIRFTQVDSLTTEGIFFRLLGKARYMIHIAGPNPWSEVRESLKSDYVNNPVETSCELMITATIIGQVKRIVITGSIAVFYEQEELLEKKNKMKYIPHEYAMPKLPAFSEIREDKMVTFAIGKTAELFYVDQYANENGRKFDVVQLLPSIILGPNPLCSNADAFNKGSNSLLLNHLLGKSTERLFTATVHIDDVARCYVESLLPCVPAGRYILNSGYTHWSDAIHIVKKYHPELVGTHFVKKPRSETYRCRISKPATIRAFALKFKSFEEQVRDTVDFYLSLNPTLSRPGAAEGEDGIGTVENGKVMNEKAVNGKAVNGKAQNGKAQNGKAVNGKGNGQNGETNRENENWESEYWVCENEKAVNGKVENGKVENGKVENGKVENGRGNGQNGEADRESENWESEYWVCENGESENWESEDWVSENWGSEETVKP
ncbi:hypothetical protein GGS21DRAFT_295022 [Xylaria nigripes]|nr:hypothetical protein GGS21DRAFT_295022 [Xylaria nigripes]